ncbi:MAG: restriction endonuclease subunit S [Chloroflexota bacterium]
MSIAQWSSRRLEDVLDTLIDYRGKTPRKTASGIPLITAKIVKQGFIQKPDEFIDEADYYAWMVRGLPQIGDVILTTEAPLGEVAQLRYEKVALAQRLVTLRGKKDVLDNDFLKYFLQSTVGQKRLLERQTGTTVTGIKQSELRKVKIDFPPFVEQKRISAILSALDDKIELNRQTNATLEAMAQAIFKEWFVNFNYPGATGEMVESELGLIPAGWRVAVFEDELDALRGLSYRGKYLEDGDAVPMHNLNSVYEGGGYKYEGIKYYSGDYKDKHVVSPGDLIVTNTEQGHQFLLIGYGAIIPHFFGDYGIYSHHIYRVRPKANSYLTSDFIFFLLKELKIRDQITGFANGTTVNMLKVAGLQKPKFVLPPKELVINFTEVNQVFRLRQEESWQESIGLAKTRDTLLPKLMRGEIDV